MCSHKVDVNKFNLLSSTAERDGLVFFIRKTLCTTERNRTTLSPSLDRKGDHMVLFSKICLAK
jgi:hypothetical protein